VADEYQGGELVAEVTRSGFTESRHLGSVAVLDARGDVVAAIGDITGPIFPRSANKPLQAVGMLRAGLQVAHAAELAVVCASHRGQPLHLDLIRTMLSRAGLSDSDLRNAATPPLADPCGESSRLHQNCSGKHAGMLLTCQAAGWPLVGYLDADHPLQQSLTATMEDLTGEHTAAIGVDGCGAPAHAFSLKAVARAFLALVESEPGTPERATGDAMRAHPEYVSGTDADAYDTVLMRTVPGLLAKGGAEGVHAAAVPGVGAVVLKIDDGDNRARMPVLRAALRRLGLDVPVPAEPVFGGGEVVGEVRAVV
jgi:L-asparaginase II